MRMLALCLIPALLLAGSHKPKSHRGGVVATAKEAKAIAERETGGRAVEARRIPLNGASGGWEVDVHMAKDERGWRCTVDSDTHMVATKTRIPNPAVSKRR